MSWKCHVKVTKRLGESDKAILYIPPQMTYHPVGNLDTCSNIVFCIHTSSNNEQPRRNPSVYRTALAYTYIIPFALGYWYPNTIRPARQPACPPGRDAHIGYRICRVPRPSKLAHPEDPIQR